MNEERMHELFREMRDEAIPTSSMQKVHQEVKAQIQQQRSGTQRWGWPLGLAAAASIMALAIFWQASPKPNEPRQITVIPPIAAPKPEPIPLPEVVQVKTDPPRASVTPVKRAVIAKPVIPSAETEKNSKTAF